MQVKEDQLKQAFWRLRSSLECYPDNPRLIGEDELTLHVVDDKERLILHCLSIKVFLNYGQEYSTRAHLASKRVIAKNEPLSDVEDEELVPTYKFKNYHFKCLLDSTDDNLVISMECTEFEYISMEIPNQDCRFLHIELSNQILSKLVDDIKNSRSLTGSSFVTFGMPKQIKDSDSVDLACQNTGDEFRELDEYQGLPVELINWDGVNFEDEEVYGYQPPGNDRGWFAFPDDTVQKLNPDDCPNSGKLIENLDEYLQKGSHLLTQEISKTTSRAELEKRKPDVSDQWKKAQTMLKQNQPSTSMAAVSQTKQPLTPELFRSSGASNLSLAPAQSSTPMTQQIKVQYQQPQTQEQPKPQPQKAVVLKVTEQKLSAADLEAELDDIELPSEVVPAPGKVKPNICGPQTAGYAASAAFY